MLASLSIAPHPSPFAMAVGDLVKTQQQGEAIKRKSRISERL
jgi:hypothetical protein